jgi:hypothetical protein
MAEMLLTFFILSDILPINSKNRESLGKMSSKEMKYNGCGTHRRAILHMIGQSVEVFNQYPTTAEIAAWMNVSKPTARKYLMRMLDNKEIMIKEVYHRPHIAKHVWKLDSEVENHYNEGILEHDYRKYAQRVLKVILTDR